MQKPANLMLDANTHQVKIVDFGSAVLTGGGTPGSSLPPAGVMTCTPAFRSPETLQSGYVPSFEMDMWALGVTIFLWVFGQLPFNGAMPFLIYESIRRQELNIPTALYTSEELKDFLGKVLNKKQPSPMDRVSRIMGGGAVSDLMSSVFYEVRLPPRTQLIAAGDTVDAIYLIAQGEVEIYQQLLLEEVEGVAPASPCQLSIQPPYF
ncbi:uncharacterized protein HaLaN_00129 [Haematococcus lacustris]|uniref:cGMP-dependent protein kinase n=1 Tax=Haematococcus lacustris TaxID=44745 RepID=A0A699Y5X5_HAELA|nr:uncharacterized protein HaLaN_00129 [Haematococcus lacustris]